MAMKFLPVRYPRAALGLLQQAVHPRFSSYPLFRAVNPGLGRI